MLSAAVVRQQDIAWQWYSLLRAHVKDNPNRLALAGLTVRAQANELD